MSPRFYYKVTCHFHAKLCIREYCTTLYDDGKRFKFTPCRFACKLLIFSMINTDLLPVLHLFRQI